MLLTDYPTGAFNAGGHGSSMIARNFSMSASVKPTDLT